MQASPVGEIRPQLPCSKQSVLQLGICQAGITRRRDRQSGMESKRESRRPSRRRALGPLPRIPDLRDADLCVGVRADVNALDETYLAVAQFHDKRSGTDAVA